MVPPLMTIQTKELILYIESIASGDLHFKGSKPYFDYQICWVYLFTAIDLTAQSYFSHIFMDLIFPPCSWSSHAGSYSLW